jgi:RNA polymerase sigma factor (TIGR02999 family)
VQSDQITEILNKTNIDQEAWEAILPIVYNQLKIMARNVKFNHKKNQNLNTTSLVHEAYIKMKNKNHLNVDGTKHFYHIAAQAMRQILVNAAKDKLCLKRNAKQMTLDMNNISNDSEADFMVKLDEIIESIEESHGRLADVFQFKYFLGFSEIEIADTMGVDVRTIRRDWLIVKKIIQEII